MGYITYINNGEGMKYVKDKHYKRVKCADGFSVSIQAGADKYCHPRSTEEGTQYTELELGFPSSSDDIIKQYAENEKDLTGTVYGYVPVDDIYLLLLAHGGPTEGEVPQGVPVYGGVSYG